jgi:hypothetical protein
MLKLSEFLLKVLHNKAKKGLFYSSILYPVNILCMPFHFYLSFSPLIKRKLLSTPSLFTHAKKAAEPLNRGYSVLRTSAPLTALSSTAPTTSTRSSRLCYFLSMLYYVNRD